MSRLMLRSRSQLISIRRKSTTFHQQRRGIRYSDAALPADQDVTYNEETGVTSTTFRTFIRHEKDDGELWYTYKPKLKRLTRKRNDKFFELSDAVLDLDQEGLEGVRVFDDDEELRQANKWAENVERDNVDKRIRQLELDMITARERWQNLLDQPVTASIISSYDVVSTALLGYGKTEEAVTVRPNEDEATTLGDQDMPPLEPRQQHIRPARVELLNTLLPLNGIPDSTKENYSSLIEWMLIRLNLLRKHYSSPKAKPISGHALIDAMSTATSIFELRRLITSYFDATASGAKSGLSTKSTAAVAANTLRLLEQRDFELEELEAAMVFIENLTARIVDQQPNEASQLWALGLQLTSRHSLHAFFASLSRGADMTFDPTSRLDTQNIIEALSILRQGLSTADPVDAWRLDWPPHRQKLLMLLAGGENEVNTVRNLAVHFAGLQKTDALTSSSLTAYLDYITVLGQLGAVHMLWFEKQSSAASIVQQRSKKAPKTMAQDMERISAAFLSAAKMALPVTSSSKTWLEDSRSALEHCLAADREAIGYMEGPRYGIQELDEERLMTALAGTLNEWLVEVQQLSR